MQFHNLCLAGIKLRQPVQRFAEREKLRQIPKDRRSLVIQGDL